MISILRTDRQDDRLTNRQTYKWMDGVFKRQTKEGVGQIDRQTDRQTERQTDRRTDRWING
jgi:hypothetical protein